MREFSQFDLAKFCWNGCLKLRRCSIKPQEEPTCCLKVLTPSRRKFARVQALRWKTWLEGRKEAAKVLFPVGRKGTWANSVVTDGTILSRQQGHGLIRSTLRGSCANLCRRRPHFLGRPMEGLFGLHLYLFQIPSILCLVVQPLLSCRPTSIWQSSLQFPL